MSRERFLRLLQVVAIRFGALASVFLPGAGVNAIERPDQKFLIEEAPPPGAPVGARAFRFRESAVCLIGRVNSITADEFGRPLYNVASDHGGMQGYPQDRSNPRDSHILVLPGGFVDPRFLLPRQR